MLTWFYATMSEIDVENYFLHHYTYYIICHKTKYHKNHMVDQLHKS